MHSRDGRVCGGPSITTTTPRRKQKQKQNKKKNSFPYIKRGKRRRRRIQWGGTTSDLIRGWLVWWWKRETIHSREVQQQQFSFNQVRWQRHGHQQATHRITRSSKQDTSHNRTLVQQCSKLLELSHKKRWCNQIENNTQQQQQLVNKFIHFSRIPFCACLHNKNQLPKWIKEKGKENKG